MSKDLDETGFMRRALALAAEAAEAGEVPVGAVIVLDGEVVGAGRNQQIGSLDPTAHAEVVALRDAATRLGNYRMPGAVLYVTVEPCAMCAGALVHARVAELVFGTREPKAGAVVSADALLDRATLNHRVAWREGLLANECAACIQAFFADRRARQREIKDRGRDKGA